MGSGDDKLYALDARNGAKKWDYTIASGQKVNTSPTVSNGLVYAGGTGGKLVALDAEIGTKKWDTSVTGGFFVPSSPAVADGILYIGDGTEDVLSLMH
ncbi:PQQ-like beta-propeller repeat protein [Spirosoma aureum]|uniref:PQQ-like beta-propeller repeat protein n=1 Tax=Spirosoma aureum TaxID=2692134 RepID=A0A6G9B051_9BACT|nr:PQQ-binding-like beta-propeller repeat protein [Spirosoma aureum]QIP18006.1 PQQ-like beta-propeller repeat protein [Spirosoma aureum]